MKTEQRIVFLAVNASYVHTNLAARCLEAFARAPGRKWHCIDALANRQLDAAVQLIVDLRPHVIATTLYVFNRDAALSILRRCHERIPDAKVIVGGPELLGDNRELLESEPHITAAIRGEGEIPFRACLESIDEPETWQEINGLCMMAGDDYIDNGIADVTDTLDEIPFAYGGAIPIPDKPMLPFETSRGCPGRCSFCTNGAVSRVRYLSETRLAADLASLRDSGHMSLRLIDRTFNDNPKRCVSLVKLFRTRFHDMQFHLEIDPARISPAIMAEFRAAPPGMFHLDVGIQSMAPDVLEAIGRYGSADRQRDGLAQLCSLEGTDVHTDLIAGLPNQTIESVYSDLTTLVTMGSAEVQLETLKLLPGTQLRAEADMLGIVASPGAPYAVLSTATMCQDEMHEAGWLSRVVDWFHGPRSLRETVVLANREIPGFWNKLCGFCMDCREDWSRPPLETRFSILDQFLSGLPPALAEPLSHSLAYAWMKKGFSHRKGICTGEQWNGPVPREALLVEGDESAEVRRIRSATIDRRYLFCYGQKGASHGAVAIYAIPAQA